MKTQNTWKKKYRFLWLVLIWTFISLKIEVLSKELTPTDPNQYSFKPQSSNVIGRSQTHIAKEEDTFYDIARRYSLGLNELQILYPKIDPWMPPKGKILVIPSCWIIPPIEKDTPLLVNIPEMRLYKVDWASYGVQTYPVSIGSKDWETPEGLFTISEKRVSPTWYIPKSLQEKYGMATMPPGPDNPLGEYVMKFSDTTYAIHGTHMPWGVGKRVSHGCLRCYPEHIRRFYPQVALGTKVLIIYEPIKLGVREGRIFAEIHPDIYHRIIDFKAYAQKKLAQHSMAGRTDPTRYWQAVHEKNGLPVDITADARVNNITTAIAADTLPNSD